jgi:hypothetical protein
MINKVLQKPETQSFFSFLIGLGIIVMLFHRPVFSIRSLALEPAQFENREIKADGKCYNYRVEDASCKNTSSK